MKAYVSLHTDRPQSQLDHEVTYKGYHRLEVEFNEQELHTQCLRCTFPAVLEDSTESAAFAAVGLCEKGQGEILFCVPIRDFMTGLPIRLVDVPQQRTREFWAANGVPDDQIDHFIKQCGMTVPRVAIDFTDMAVYPDHLNPIARVAHKLVTNGLMRPEELHPKLFEAINDALANAGVPILHVVRGAAAKMNMKIEDLRFSKAAGHA